MVRGEEAVARSRRWGTRSALLDDDEARRRLVDATIRCITRAGTGRIRVEDVADEAGVSRATLYRYFRSREELVLGVLLSRLDAGLVSVIRSLKHPRDASRSIPDLILTSIAMIDGDVVNEALFSPDSHDMVLSLEATAQPIADRLHMHVGPLLEQWRLDGQLHPDLDLRQTSHWINTVALMLTTPPWSSMSKAAKRTFLNRYLVRALVVDPSASPT